VYPYLHDVCLLYLLPHLPPCFSLGYTLAKTDTDADADTLGKHLSKDPKHRNRTTELYGPRRCLGRRKVAKEYSKKETKINN